MPGTVSSRGQITIDLEARRELGVEPGMVAYQRVVDGRLEVVFLPAPHARSLAGLLHRPGEGGVSLMGEELEGEVMLGLAADEERSD